MAEFSTVGLEAVIESLSRREKATVEAVPKMLKAGAAIVAEKQKEEAANFGINKTGGLIQSIKPTRIKKEGSASVIDIYPQGKAPHGNERKGDKSNVRYATIGFITEYGTSSMPARPWLTTATSRAEPEVIEAQLEVWEKAQNG